MAVSYTVDEQWPSVLEDLKRICKPGGIIGKCSFLCYIFQYFKLTEVTKFLGNIFFIELCRFFNVLPFEESMELRISLICTLL